MPKLRLPPLSLYIHIPWCVKKCPYCDFNSHGMPSNGTKGGIPEAQYVEHLLADLAQEATRVAGRVVRSLFFGGGTPSLFSPTAIAEIINGVKQRVDLSPEAEITLEANPGTVEAQRFAGFRAAGVNRLSVGVQSFHPEHLQQLGRIHSADQALQAIAQAKAAGLHNVNLDLMHGLPQQTLAQALADLRQALALGVPHISWYQLTIEPNTLFASRPPTLPESDTLADIQEQGHALLLAQGYQQYEVSAYSLPNHQCQHNLNYWRFGDYVGIGCGAHGKLTDIEGNTLWRRVKVKHPTGYMQADRAYTDRVWEVPVAERPFEFFMNQLRLFEPCPVERFSTTTGLPWQEGSVRKALDLALAKGWLQEEVTTWQTSAEGKRWLNEVLALFLVE